MIYPDMFISKPWNIQLCPFLLPSALANQHFKESTQFKLGDSLKADIVYVQSSKSTHPCSLCYLYLCFVVSSFRF